MKKIESFMQIAEGDNVAVALTNIKRGQHVMGIEVKEDILCGHKIALTDIPKSGSVIKYGYVIGSATRDISRGEHVHTHNIKTNLCGEVPYVYEPVPVKIPVGHQGNFMGYKRRDGKVGIRNEIWIIPTVGCIGRAAERIADEANRLYGGRCDGFFAYHHLYGCSQLGEDAELTQRTLINMVNHPNAAGVLVMGLGCENNNIPAFKKALGEWDEQRVRFLNAQDVEDEVAAALDIIGELVEYAGQFKREACDISKLTFGLKCGASDGFSGITCNPLLGKFADKMVGYGCSIVLTETSEMFGGEQQLLNRCANEQVFNNMVKMINDFKQYYIRHNQVIYENPSQGNKAGGISTLEDKSLGCIQKYGRTGINAILDYGQQKIMPGLNLLKGPGNDMVAITGLMSAGAHMVLFTTGRGVPVGAPVPTLKISSNSALANQKSNWIDFNTGTLLEGESDEEMLERLFNLVMETAEGKKAQNEINGYREISIFKEGVIL